MRLANAVLGQDAAIGAEPMLYAATADVDGGAYIEPGGLMNMRGHPTVGRSNDASYDRDDDAGTLGILDRGHRRRFFGLKGAVARAIGFKPDQYHRTRRRRCWCV